MSVFVPAPKRQKGCLSNCETCDHKLRPDGGYCYMFHTEPDGKCYQHTSLARPLTGLEGLIDSAKWHDKNFRKENS